MAAYYWTRTMLFGVDTPGFPTLVVSIAFFSGVQLISLGVLGEYVARIFNEVKGRPLYLIAERLGDEEADSANQAMGLRQVHAERTSNDASSSQL